MAWRARGSARRLTPTCSRVRGACVRGLPDSALIDEALAALARERTADVDETYAAYDAHPLDEHDEWGDLASFRAAADAS